MKRGGTRNGNVKIEITNHQQMTRPTKNEKNMENEKFARCELICIKINLKVACWLKTAPSTH